MHPETNLLKLIAGVLRVLAVLFESLAESYRKWACRARNRGWRKGWMSHDIYLRAHTVPISEKDKPKGAYIQNEPKWSDYALVFDCESRITADQTLTFGFWRFCELRNGRVRLP